MIEHVKHSRIAVAMTLCAGIAVSAPLQANTVSYADHAPKYAMQHCCDSADDESGKIFGKMSFDIPKPPSHTAKEPNHWMAELSDWKTWRSDWKDHLDIWQEAKNKYLDEFTPRHDGKYCPVDTPSAVPVPASVWLLLSGLTGLVGWAKHKSR